MTSNVQIYCRCLEFLAPLELPSLAGIDFTGIAGRVPDPPAELLSRLLQEHPCDALVASGVAEASADGTLRLVERLNHPGRIVVGVFRRSGSPPLALLAEGEVIGSFDVAAMGSSAGGLWAANSSIDATFLGAAGLTVVPGSLLADALESHPEKAAEIIVPVNAWDDPRLAPREEAVALIKRLRGLRRATATPLPVAVLRAEAEDREEILEYVRRRDPALRDYLLARGRALQPDPAQICLTGILRNGLPEITSRKMRGPLSGRPSEFHHAFLRIEAFDATLDIPTRAKLLTKVLIKGKDPGVHGANLINGMLTSIPRDCFLHLLTAQPKEWGYQLVVAMTRGWIPGPEALPDIAFPRPKGRSQEPPAPQLPTAMEKFFPMRRVRVRLMNRAGQAMEQESVDAVLVCPPSLQVGDAVEAAVEICVDPITSKRFLFAEDVSPAQQLAPGMSAGPGKRAEEVVRPFCVDGTLESLDRRAGQIAKDLAGEVLLSGRQVERTAVLVALVHLSALQITLPNGRRLANGCLQILIGGETASHKTTMTVGLSSKIGLAHVASGDTCTRAGLLQKQSGDRVVPGLLPLCSGRMVILDEAHKLSPNQFRAMTFARSEGELRVLGAASGSFPMRTRMILVGNLRSQAYGSLTGSRSVAVQDLEGGILGLRFVDPEDLRRFDAVAITTRAGAGSALETRPETTCMAAFRELAELHWDLDSNGWSEIVWEDGAFPVLRQQAASLQEQYGLDALPLVGADTADKLARLAVAAARLMPTRPSAATYVTAVHVVWAAGLLRSLYEDSDNGLAALAARCGEAALKIRLAKLTNLFNRLTEDEIPELWHLVVMFSKGGHITTADIAMEIGTCPRTAYRHLKYLKELGLVTSHGRGGIRATADMMLLARSLPTYGPLPNFRPLTPDDTDNPDQACAGPTSWPGPPDQPEPGDRQASQRPAQWDDIHEPQDEPPAGRGSDLPNLPDLRDSCGQYRDEATIAGSGAE